MSAVSETIVREFFELQGFFLRQQRKFVGREDDEIDFLVWPAGGTAAPSGTTPAEAPALPFELAADDLAQLGPAVVSVRGWHTDVFTAGLLVRAPEVFRFAEPPAVAQAAHDLPAGTHLRRVLVIPALPTDALSRRQSVELLQARGIDAVLPFRVMLAALLDAVETNRNYQKSDLLQVLRILKLYGFVRDPQLELFRGAGGSGARRRHRIPPPAGAPALPLQEVPADSTPALSPELHGTGTPQQAQQTPPTGGIPDVLAGLD
jgi:hypothetical protein